MRTMTKQNIRKKYRGKFIVFEGLDGAGSTTQCSKLLELLNELGWPVAYTKEPSNGPMGLMIQLILAGRIQLNALGKSITDLSRESLALLFASDRLDHLEHEIEPTLTDGVSVICDRYYLSSFAYQLSDDKSNFGWLKSVNDKCIKPDLHIYIETSVTTCLKRISSSILRWKKQLYENKNKL